MNKIKFILVAVGILLALAFTFSCTSDDGGGDISQLSSSGTESLGESSSSLQTNASSGSQNRLYLGYGYDVIKSSYINRNDVKMLYPVLDQKRIIDDGLIASDQIGGMQEFETYVGNSLTEFYEKRNERIGLGLSASVPIKIVLFSGKFESEFGVSLSESRIDTNNYLRGRSSHYIAHEYISNGRATAKKLAEYLSEDFLADMRSKTAAQILDKYGSHIFIQYYKGGAMEYSYAYYGSKLEKSTDLSSALSVSLSAKIGIRASVDASSSWVGQEESLQKELENNSTFRSYSYGGALVNFADVDQIKPNYIIWLNSIEDRADICGIGKFDESFISVWELASASGESELANELEKEFLNRVEEQENNLQKAKVKVETKEFTVADTYAYTFDKSFPATVYIYALGAGGGGQGGNRNIPGNPFDNTWRGTGATGGGGSAAYMKLSIEQPETFDITVGKGGSGGGGVSIAWCPGCYWQSGNPGDGGGSTSVKIGSTTITAEGGRGGGGAGTVLTGGAGGSAGSRPTGLLDWFAASGASGNSGNEKQDLRGTNRGGSAAVITGKGSETSFGGSLGGMNGVAAQAGGGGAGGYDSSQSGSVGGDGMVLIVITYEEDL